jgi:uncharacterized protein
LIDGLPVLDAVVHAYNWSEENMANRHAKVLLEVTAGGGMLQRAGYQLPPDAFASNWSIEEVATVSFLESDTDIAVHHHLPIRAFKDGLCSLEKTVEAIARWPDRFIAYMGVDPMEGTRALEDMERQMEILGNPVGLKLYPNSWIGEEFSGWLMDDPEIAFPCFRKAEELGLKVVAIHKAVPLGPVPMEHYKMDDIDRAAIEFPNLNFEVVHGGMAFLEETAWQLARFSNVYVNLEITTSLAATKPLAFERAMATLLMAEPALDRILWGTGALAFHPQPILEAFVNESEFSQEVVDDGVPQLTEEVKRKILWDNYAAMTGIDIDARLDRIKGDEFAERRARTGRPPAYSTTQVADRVVTA